MALRITNAKLTDNVTATGVPETWAENHCVIDTAFDNISERPFTMTIMPEQNKKELHGVIAFAFVVVFESEPTSFPVDFELGEGEKLNK